VDERIGHNRLSPRPRFAQPAPHPSSELADAAQLGTLAVLESSDSEDSEDESAEAVELRRRVEAVFAECSLSPFLMAGAMRWVKQMGDPAKGADLEHIRLWLLHEINAKVAEEAGRRPRRPMPASPWQSGCPGIIPRLRAKPWWARGDSPWLATLEDGFETARAELLALRGQGRFQPYRGPSRPTPPHAGPRRAGSH
jgi:hypothetical protein